MGHKERLQGVIAGLQQRWGKQVIYQPAQSIAHVPTGFASIDRAFGIGGLPCGHITEMLGTRTSGLGTLALKFLASAQAQGHMAVYIDPSQTFDADYAVRCGVNLDSLLLVRPSSQTEALDIAFTLVTSRSAGILIYDRSTTLDGLVPQTFNRFISPLASTACVFICLLPFAPHHLGIEASVLRLLVERQGWLRRRQDVNGYQVRLTILKNKFGAPHRPVRLTLGFSRVVAGDGA